jgi:hypothetical protein
MNVILKTILSQEAELLFVASQFLELQPLIDRIIIIDPEFTHTGVYKKRVGMEGLLAAIPELSNKLDYIPLPMMPEVIQDAQTERDCHRNELITRGSFTRYIDLSPQDVVISTDADEVIYLNAARASVERVTSRVISWRAETLALHQFIYKDTLIAPDFHFTGPSVIGCGRYFLVNRPFNWRYAGPTIDGYSGCHFSWCMPLPNLEAKVRSFAHAPSYLARAPDALQQITMDISRKTYSFRSTPIHLEDLPSPHDLWPRGYIAAKKLMLENI